MTQEERQLLLRDLCARLPYGVKVNYADKIYDVLGYHDNNLIIVLPFLSNLEVHPIETCKPYLRPMSSMTEAEIEELRELTGTDEANQYGFSYSGLIGECFGMMYDDCSELVDWLNEHHIDYRRLIEKGLAIEAPEGMYNE